MIGCDIVLISRIEKSYNKHKQLFLDKFLSKDEQKIITNTSSLAGFFAAKEAALKALGVGISSEAGFLDVKISKDHKNKPLLDFSEKVNKNFGIKSSSLSISHDGGFAIAVVALECEKEGK